MKASRDDAFLMLGKACPGQQPASNSVLCSQQNSQLVTKPTARNRGVLFPMATSSALEVLSGTIVKRVIRFSAFGEIFLYRRT